jgi:hypothetical protein
VKADAMMSYIRTEDFASGSVAAEDVPGFETNRL